MRCAMMILMMTTLPAAALDGVFDTDCSAEVSEMRVTIARGEISFWESSCRLTNPVNVRDIDGAVLYDAVCSGEGEEWTLRMLLMPGHDGGLIRVVSGFAITYDRCR